LKGWIVQIIGVVQSLEVSTMDETSTLVAIQTLRTNSAYHDAEILRRKTEGGAANMALAAEDSPEYAAIHLLINTWEAIAVLMSGLEQRDRIYEVTPVCHMHNHLKDAITNIVLKHTKLKTADELSIPNAGYGANFSILANDYDNWLKRKNKSAQYITGACDGMYACFG
jgi:hypothetical protein